MLAFYLTLIFSLVFLIPDVRCVLHEIGHAIALIITSRALNIGRPPRGPRIAREHKRWFTESIVYDVLAEMKNVRWIQFNAVAGFAFTLFFIIVTQAALLVLQFRHDAVLGICGTLMALTVIAAHVFRFFSSNGDGDAAIACNPALFYELEDTDT
jgi:hypothetical protein